MAQPLMRNRRAKFAAGAALVAAWLPGGALGQSLTGDGQTLPRYDAPDPFLQGPAGPALAPTENPDANARYADGTEKTIQIKCRIDTAIEIEYVENGGVLHYVLRNLAQA